MGGYAVTGLEGIGTAGAPVSSYFCIVNKGDNVYAGLLEMLWLILPLISNQEMPG